MHPASPEGGLMRASLIRFAAGLVVIAAAALACRQGDPAIDPKTPPNSPVPTKLERPDDWPTGSPTMPTLTPDGGKTR